MTIENNMASPESGIKQKEESPKSESTGILLSTLWNQSGICNIGNNTTIRYNEYTPIDTDTGEHSVTGCTNTAAGQLIYYFIEKKGLTLT
ncbi:MAG: C10 family peptidase [Lentisphaeria bacterium]|nr:C10 family peptidase [Lentisphaeria bacterium]